MVLYRVALVMGFLGVAAILDFGFFTVSYGVLRVVRIPVSWVTRAIGWLIIVLALSATAFLPFNGTADGIASLMGVFSFGVGIYAIGEWLARRWYLTVKRVGLAFISRAARDFYLFVRQHHNFFGWIVLITAWAHALAFLPLLDQVSFGAVWSGALAWVAVTLLFCLGLLTDRRMQLKRRVPRLRRWHIGLGFTFFAIILLHIVAIL